MTEKTTKSKSTSKLGGNIEPDISKARIKIELLRILTSMNINNNKDAAILQKEAENLYKWVNEE